MRFDRRLLRLAYTARFVLGAGIALGTAGGFLLVFQARLLSQVTAGVFLGEMGLEGAARPLALLLGAFILRSFLIWGSDVSAGIASARIRRRLRQHLFEHILHLGPSFGVGERTGELVNTCLEGVDALDAYFSQYLPQAALAALVPLTYLAFIFPLDPLSAVVLLVTAPLIPIFMVLIGSRAEALTRRQWVMLSRLSAYFLDVLQGLATLKTMGRSRAQIPVIEQASERYRQTTMGILKVTFLSALALEMVATLSTAIVAVEIGLRLLYGKLGFEGAFFVLLLAPEFYLPVRTLGARFHAGMAGVAAAGRIFDILAQPIQTTKASSGESGTAPSLTGGFGEITFDDVSLVYPDGRKALDGVSFRIPAGQKTALVGRSGAGKSSLVGLLLGFSCPTSGQVRVDGDPLSEIPLGEWHKQVAWVPQKPTLFHDTAAANIHLGQQDAVLEEVMRAAQKAGADEFIRSLPQGYNTSIGERGGRLSGGQAQCIALSRAFFKDAPLLILDEATSNLAPDQEDQLQRSLNDLAAGRTIVVIAHRLSTVYQADQIVLLDDGKVVAHGTHASLIEGSDLYRELVLGYAGAGADGLPGPSSVKSVVESIPRRDFSTQYGDILPRPLESTVPSKAAEHEVPAKASLWHVLARLLRLASPYRGMVMLSALLGFLTVASGMGLMTTSAYIISAAALKPSIADLQVAIVGVRFFGIARGLFRYLERYSSHNTTFRLLARLRVWFYQSVEPLAPARLVGLHGGDLLNRVIGDIASLEGFYVRSLAPPLVAGMICAVSFIFMASFSSGLAFNLLAFLLLGGIGVPWWVHRIGRNAGSRQIHLRSELSASLVDGIQGAADLLVYGRAKEWARRLEYLGRQYTSQQTVTAAIGAAQSALVGLLSNLAVWCTLLLAIPLIRLGQIEGVYLTVLVLAALTAFEAVLPLPQAAQHLAGNLEAARRLFEVGDAEPAVRDPELPAAAEDVSVNGFDVEIRDVSFSFPDVHSTEQVVTLSEAAPVLEGINLYIPRGKRVAVVGPSGAGKTTLANLLLRFWEFQEGEILAGGRDLRGWKADSLRDRIAVVPQNPYLFNTSLRENLLIARPDASEEELLQALRQAQLDGFIRSLPEGLNTWLGEQGVRLSGGERQRLAIARAFLRQADLLIFDEPTANLDSQVERRILEALEQHASERSLLLITHRLVGLESMDEVVVLKGGHIVERGRHETLLASGGLYRRMWEIQNQILKSTLALD